MKPLISMVIPVYNVEPYLTRCVESVLDQTFTDFEVILVDDGSTDASGQLCDAFAEADNRVRAYHKPNGGLSDARNFGVDRAEADLITFVDSDDYISSDYLQRLWTLKESTGADITIVGIAVVWWNGNIQKRPSSDSDNPLILERDAALEAMFYGRPFNVSACAKLYRKAVVVKHPFPVGEIYEDLLTIYKYVQECDSVAYDEKPGYYYCQRNGGTMLAENIDDCYWKALDQTYKIYLQFQGENERIAKAVRCRYLTLSISYMEYVRKGTEQNKSDFRGLKASMKKVVKMDVLFDPLVNRKLKIKYLTVCLGYHPMCLLWRLIDRLHGRPE